MSSTALTIPSRAFGGSADHLASYLGSSTYQLPGVIEQEPGPLAQFALAWVYIRLAAALIWHGLAALPGHAGRAASARLARIPHTYLLFASTSGLIGWACSFTLAVLLIWR